MLLRPRQRTFVERCTAALDEHRNTLGVAPTGFGKTIAISGLLGGYLKRGIDKALVCQHRDELLSQNSSKFLKVVPNARPSIYNAERKSWHGDVVFASEPTLRRTSNLEKMPPVDLVVIDEAHHVAADGYQRIVDRARELNPNVLLFGCTATPGRGDKKGLKGTFDNVGDQVYIKELIASGHLVRPRTFVIDVGVKDELKKVRRLASDYDMAQVEQILNKAPITDAVIEHWRAKAGDRQTVVFCSTVNHAEEVCRAFNEAGIAAVLVHGELDDQERRRRLKAYADGDAQVVVNVFVLTEGWDHPPTSCVILLRPSSYKGTYIQCIGRGLRVIDPELHPGVVKTDCIVLDFGMSTLRHGTIEQDVDLDPQKGMAPVKDCPQCGEAVPLGTLVCPGCGYEFEIPAEEELEEDGGEGLRDFVMSEVDLLERSPFRWVDLFDDDHAMMASGFEAWAGAFCLNGIWHAIGGLRRQPVRYLGCGERIVALALADDHLNMHETDEACHKTKRWLNQPATEKQLALLGQQAAYQFGLTKYRASCLLNFQFNKDRIQRTIMARAA